MNYQDVLRFANAADLWLQGKLEGGKPVLSKLTYAARKMLERTKPILAAYQERLEDIRIEHAEAKDGVILLDDHGRMLFSKDGLRKCNAAIRLFTESQVQIDPYLVAPVEKQLESLPYGLQAALTGFVLPAVADVEPTE